MIRVRVLKDGQVLQFADFESKDARDQWVDHLKTGKSAWGDFSTLTIVDEDPTAEYDAKKAKADTRANAIASLQNIKQGDHKSIAQLEATVLKIAQALGLA